MTDRLAFMFIFAAYITSYRVEGGSLACENQWLNLNCGDGGTMDVVSANYGRSEGSHCGGPVRTTSCSAQNTLAAVRAACQDTKQCSILASNSVFGDPCVGTVKYLDVNYICRHTSQIRHMACEGEPLSISCPTNHKLEIFEANYGRTSGSACRREPIRTTDCRTPNAVNIVRHVCEGVQGCSVLASNVVFGDPCIGTVKYLEVVYGCKPGEPIFTKTACENSAATLSCPFDQVVKVTDANYGRTDRGTCTGGPILNTNCRSSNSLGLMEVVCTGVSSCSVSASNAVFGDPCPGTYKYLDVRYKCEKASVIRRNTCEHGTLKLECPAGHAITPVKANYGRTEAITCRGGPIRSTWCFASNSLHVVQASCQGFQTCDLVAGNNVFGDPCVGTFKYLDVEYKCEPAVNRRQKVCEHGSMKLECGADQVIEIVRANYGRIEGSSCTGGPIRTTFCYAGNSMTLVRNMCLGKRECTVTASNSVFGDPCVGTFKYLDVTYKCNQVAPPTTHPPPPVTTPPTLPPTPKITTPPVTSPPTHPPTPKITTPPVTSPPTHPPTPKITTPPVTSPPTHPPTPKITTPPVTSPPTHPPTPKITTPPVTHPPTPKITTPPVTPPPTHPPTPKITTPPVTTPPTHPPTPKITTPPVTSPPTHPPTPKITTPPVTSPPTHPPTPKITTPHSVTTHPPLHPVTKPPVIIPVTRPPITPKPFPGYHVKSVCEHQELNMECDHGKFIYVNSALFGRTLDDVCDGSPDTQVACMLEESLELITSLCEGENNCTLVADKYQLFEPCPFVESSMRTDSSIYLKVNYTCRDRKIPRGVQSKVFCENHFIHLDCEEDIGSVIHVASARFHHEDSACGHDGPTDDDDLSACTTVDYLQKMKHLCVGKKKCGLLVEEGVMGPLCSRPFNSLKVEFECKKVPTRVRDLFVYKKGRFMVGLAWSLPLFLHGKLESFRIKSIGSDKTYVIKPTSCVPWPDMFCFIMTGLTPNTNHTFEVSAKVENGSFGAGAKITAETVESGPAAPLDLMVVSANETTATIKWKPPRKANGLLRSFLLRLEETNSYDPTLCCQFYPMKEIEVTDESEEYSTEIGGLNPGSTYAVSVAGVTAWLGAPALINLHTRPPPPSDIPLPNVQLNTASAIEWKPDDVQWEGNYSSLIQCNLLLLVTDEASNQDVLDLIDIRFGGEDEDWAPKVRDDTQLAEDVADLTALIKKAIDGNRFDVVAQYQKGDEIVLDGSEGEPEPTNCGLTASKVPLRGGNTYRLAAVQVLKYNGLYSVGAVQTKQFMAA